MIQFKMLGIVSNLMNLEAILKIPVQAVVNVMNVWAAVLSEEKLFYVIEKRKI